MTTNGFIFGASVAVRGALVAMTLAAFAGSAAAQEPAKTAAAAPIKETPKASTVEIGIGDLSDGSYKAGEYNGLEKKGGLAIGNLDLRDSAAYDGTSALRWRVGGNDLGLGTRSFSADVRQQGKFHANFDFDQLRRNRSDSYQTPYSGAGTGVLTLPNIWQVPTVAGSSGTNSVTNVLSARGLSPAIGIAPYIDIRTTSTTLGAVLTPTAAQAAQVSGAAAADLAAFQNVKLFTKRTKYEAGFTYSFNDRWGFGANVRPEHKDGLKPMGTVSRNSGGDISAIIPDQIDQNHNQIDTNLSFKGTRTFAQVGYYGSFFSNNVRSMSWQNWATGPTSTGPGTVNVMSSTPSNDFSQISGSGGFKISPATRLVANGSYARNTQNDTFLTDDTTPVVPVRSLNGLVVTTLFNAKLTTRFAKKLNLTGSYKYNDRDNRTPVNIYQYADAGESAAANANFAAGPNNPLGAVLAQNANANRPYGTRLNQVNFDADYALGGGQWIKGGYDFQKIDRACHGSWIDCADVATSKENTLRADWRASVGGDFTARAGYAYSTRRGTYNENAFLALVPYANVSPAAATGGATALSFMNANGWNGWGPALGFVATTGNMNVFFPSNNALANAMYANGNRISELAGLRRYSVADRNRDKVRTSLAWQANETWSLQGGVDLNKDHYPDTTFGLQDAKGWATNLDVTYSPTDNLSTNVFYTFEKLRSLTGGQHLHGEQQCQHHHRRPAGHRGSCRECLRRLHDAAAAEQQQQAGSVSPLVFGCARRRAHRRARIEEEAGKLDLLGNLTFARSRSDNSVTGGNWANNLLNGPGAAPTTFAAVLIPATPFPTVSSDTTELRLSGTWALAKAQSLRVAYAYLHMTSSDWIYAGHADRNRNAQRRLAEQRTTVQLQGQRLRPVLPGELLGTMLSRTARRRREPVSVRRETGSRKRGTPESLLQTLDVGHEPVDLGVGQVELLHGLFGFPGELRRHLGRRHDPLADVGSRELGNGALDERQLRVLGVFAFRAMALRALRVLERLLAQRYFRRVRRLGAHDTQARPQHAPNDCDSHRPYPHRCSSMLTAVTPCPHASPLPPSFRVQRYDIGFRSAFGELFPPAEPKPETDEAHVVALR